MNFISPISPKVNLEFTKNKIEPRGPRMFVPPTSRNKSHTRHSNMYTAKMAPSDKTGGKTEWTPQEVYKMMGEIKGQNIIIKTLHEQINASLDLLEASIIENPFNATMKRLYLSTLALHRRDKMVVAYEEEETIVRKSGTQKVWTRKSGYYDINDEGDWMVSIVRGGKAVRVVLTAAGAERVKSIYNSASIKAPTRNFQWFSMAA